jgi:Bacterial Ig domain/Lysyl oxidase
MDMNELIKGQACCRQRRFAIGWILGIFLVLFVATPVWCAVAIDVNVSTNRSSSASNITSPSFSTASTNELLLAFLATDGNSSGITVTSVTGANLTWVLVRRTNLQLGTTEIWRAFAPTGLSNVTVRANLSQSVAASITIVGFTGIDTSGTSGSGAIGATGSNNANPGAPTASLITTRNNSWVFGVGNDWDRATARTLGANQTMVNQYLASVGDTYWVQRQNAPTALSGTSVTINDTAPTNDRFNLTIVEVLPAPATGSFNIFGSITPAASGVGAKVQLSGAASAFATADANGNYSFAGLGNGTYTVTPSKIGFNFSPTSQQVTISGLDQTVPTFTATAQTWTISGTITPTSSGAGSNVTLSQGSTTITTVTAGANGTYSFSGLANGTYAVTPSKTGYTFSPTAQTVTVNGTNASNINFTATAVQTYSISGNISPGSAGAGSLLSLSGTPSTTTIADVLGNYTFSGLGNGTYTVTPSKTGYTFNPTTQTVMLPVNSGNAIGINFTISANPPPLFNYPDLSDLIPVGQISVVGSGNNRVFQYTHDTFNGGSGPLVIQPIYNQASGNYQGIQYIYSFSGGIWMLAQQIPVAGAFVFDAAHGHFHFPFSTYGLYNSNADGSVGAAVALSGKTGFCIDDSFIYDPSLPNAGALGNLGSCTDPTTLRGLDIGAVDEYDQTDLGQSISIAGLPDGTYWLRAVVDPDNYLAESDKSNNETDVQLTITGNTVQVLQTVTPVLPPPPGITLTLPLNGSTVAGTVNLTATTSSTGGVQFLVDGLPFGAVVTTSPFTLAWNTTSVANGAHWLAAQTTDSTGRTGTSGVVTVTVSNGSSLDTTPPTVKVNDPSQGAIVSASVAVTATAADDTAVINVQFYLDGVALGAPLTAPPYIIYWDTLNTTNGQHTITASATDTVGLVGNSAPVTVTVDNSHPANVIGKEVTAFVDGSGTMQTPVFSTTTQDDLLVAFVGYDGPPGSPQTASVSGAGLTWILLKRSDVQNGTSEMWAARANGVLTNVFVISQPGVSGYHGSMTVIAFTNASGPGVVGQASAPSGTPDIFLPGVAAGSWVFAVGNDWDNAIARTPVSGQVLVHQRIDTGTGDTYWVQSTTIPSTAFALVDIHDNSPTSDQWNYAAVEIVATRQ